MLHVPPPNAEMSRSADLLFAYQSGQEAAGGDASAAEQAKAAFANDPELLEQYELGLAGRPMNGAASAEQDQSAH